MSSSWLCVDANLVIRLVTDPSDESIQRQWELWDNGRQKLAAPSLLYYEVANALHRYRTLGLMSGTSLQLAFEAALALPIELHYETDLHWRAMDLAGRLSLPAAYGAHYLALAELLRSEFWTSDRRLVRAVQASLPWVHLVE